MPTGNINNVQIRSLMSSALILQEISRFLKNRRANLNAENFGFPIGQRRGKGLRREEVASLSGVSVTWYTWLEQGKDIRVSQDMIQRLASALKLNATEREYLIQLILSSTTLCGNVSESHLSSRLTATIDSLSVPAFIRNPRWDLLYWNAAAAEFIGECPSPSSGKNILRLAFLDKSHQATILDWERTAREMVAQLRNDFGRHARYPGVVEIIEELKESSTIFRQHWDAQEILYREFGLRTFRHPVRGDITFERCCLMVDSDASLKIEAYIPVVRDQCQ